MQNLEVLYNQTNGANWNWLQNFSSFGKPWNFDRYLDGSYKDNPCLDHWQGICCSNLISKSLSQQCTNMALYFGSVPQLSYYFYYYQYTENSATFYGNEPEWTIVGLDLKTKHLKGSLPASIFEGLGLNTLKHLNLQCNQLSHTLPSSIGYLTDLVSLELELNHFTGKLPSTLGLLTNLEIFCFNENKFSGQLPSSLGNLVKLSMLWGHINHFTGSFPHEFSGLLSLTDLEMHRNKFSGTFPSVLGSITALKIMLIDSNYFSGSLPTHLSLLTNLMKVSIGISHLTGTIPSELGALTAVQGLYIGRTYITGTVPVEVLELPYLYQLLLLDNQLSGPLPPALGNMTLLTRFNISGNYLSGELSTCIGLMTALEYSLDLSSNFLSGTIPSEIGSLTSLAFLSLSDNLLHGLLPDELTLLVSLRTLFLGSNSFQGQLNQCFSKESQTELSLIDLSENNFSGTLPMQIFELPSIATVMLIKNCFEGSLTDQICLAKSLITVVMDGLTTGTFCSRNRLLSGTIPACLFQITTLSTLQLSGNGLQGTLPNGINNNQAANFTIAPQLVSLTLSHNRLSGPIPRAFQTHQFEVLDLSYNKLSGELNQIGGFFVPPSTRSTTTRPPQLCLAVNRLSGLLPESFYQGESLNLQVVGGNGFGCRRGQNYLPAADPGSLTAQCGSDNLNAVLIAWGVALAAMLIAFSCFVWSASKRRSLKYATIQPTTSKEESVVPVTTSLKIFSYLKVSSDLASGSLMNDASFGNLSELPNLRSLQSYISTLKLTDHIFLVITLLIVLVYLPIILALKWSDNFNNTSRTMQYAYLSSLAYLRGPLSAGLLVALTIILCCIVLWLLRHKAQSDENQQIVLISSWTNLKPSRFFAPFCLLFLTINVGVLAGANAAYIYVTLSQTQTRIFEAQIALVLFKLYWSTWVLPAAWLRMKGWFVAESKMLQSHLVVILSCLLMINNILIPIIVTMFSDPVCLEGIIVPPQPVIINLQYIIQCYWLYNPTSCSPTIAYLQLNYIPPFIYSSQCCSSIMTAYLPVYLLLYFQQSVINSLLTWIAAKLLNSPSGISKIIETLCIWILGEPACCLCKSEQYFIHTAARMLSPQSAPTIPTLVCAEDVMAWRIYTVAVLVTFGVAYPPLAVLISVSMWIQSVQQRLGTGRIITMIKAAKEESKFSLWCILTHEVGEISESLAHSTWLIIWTISVFFTFFVYDFIDDMATESRGYLLAPLLLLSWPVVMMIALNCTSSLSSENILRIGTKSTNSTD